MWIMVALKVLVVILSLVGWVMGWGWAHPLFAAEIGSPIFTDSFDDGDISDWTVQRNIQYRNPNRPCMNGSQPAEWQVVDGRAGIVIDGPWCTTEITPPNVVLAEDEGFVYEFDWWFGQSITMDRNVVFLWQADNRWYDLKILNHEIMMQKLVDDHYSLAVSEVAFPFQPNQSYHFEVRYTPDQRIIVSIDGQQVFDLQDEAPFMAGPRTIGLQASVGAISRSVSFFDNLVVSLLPTESDLLSMIHFWQTDDQWKDDEYDTATEWSDTPTIGRWGCAMTSMAMILQYHGISELPDGSYLDPKTLNAWLIDQPDGYVGSGLLNWQAVTRLTQEMSPVLNTPKLEYGRSSGSETTLAATEIQAKKPVILQIPGHFLVSHGVLPGGNGENPDLAILDPSYRYNKLSEHEVDLLSTRTFQPSQTDLSYLLLVHDPEVQVQLQQADGSAIENVETFSEQLRDPSPGSDRLSPLKVVTQLAKPESGQYQVLVSQPEFGQFEVEIWAYDQAANPTELSIAGLAGPKPLHYQLEFNKNGHSNLAAAYSYQSLSEDLAALTADRHITSRYWYSRLNRVAQAGIRLEQLTSPNQSQLERLHGLMTASLRHAARYLTKTGQTYLQQQLTHLSPV